MRVCVQKCGMICRKRLCLTVQAEGTESGGGDGDELSGIQSRVSEDGKCYYKLNLIRSISEAS